MPKAQITEAEICRALRAADKSGHTVYGYAVEGNIITVHTHPIVATATSKGSEADKWFDDD